MSPYQALQKAVEVLHGQTALANACGDKVKQQHVYNWLNRDKKLPPQYAIKVQKATDGAVKASDLCPDVFTDDEQAA